MGPCTTYTTHLLLLAVDVVVLPNESSLPPCFLLFCCCFVPIEQSAVAVYVPFSHFGGGLRADRRVCTLYTCKYLFFRAIIVRSTGCGVSYKYDTAVVYCTSSNVADTIYVHYSVLLYYY